MRQPATFALLAGLTLGAAALALVGTGCEARATPGNTATTATTPGPATPSPGGASSIDGEPTKIAFTVDGMHCDGCVAAVTTSVSKIDGVQECDVSLDDREAIVTVSDPTIAKVILETIAKLGYTVEEKPIDDGSAEG